MTEDEATALRRQLGWLSETEVAALSGCDTRTLANWRSSRSGPSFSKIGRTVLYSAESLNAWLKAREQETQP